MSLTPKVWFSVFWWIAMEPIEVIIADFDFNSLVQNVRIPIDKVRQLWKGNVSYVFAELRTWELKSIPWEFAKSSVSNFDLSVFSIFSKKLLSIFSNSERPTNFSRAASASDERFFKNNHLGDSGMKNQKSKSGEWIAKLLLLHSYYIDTALVNPRGVLGCTLLLLTDNRITESLPISIKIWKWRW